MRSFVSVKLLFCVGAMVLCTVAILRYSAEEETAVTIVAMVPQSTRAMEKTSLMFELTNVSSFDVRVVGLNSC